MTNLEARLAGAERQLNSILLQLADLQRFVRELEQLVKELRGNAG